jgi:hypothetical protein
MVHVPLLQLEVEKSCSNCSFTKTVISNERKSHIHVRMVIEDTERHHEYNFIT